MVEVVLGPTAPVIVNDSLKFAFEEELYADTIKVEDPDEEDTFTFSLLNNPDWLGIDNNGVLSGIPLINDVGTDSLSIRVEDSFGLADTLTTAITVYPTIFVEEYNPLQYRIYSPFPNPFNSTITIQYAIPSKSHVKMVIYDMLGREITTLKDNLVSAGLHETVWDGRNNEGLLVGSGVYLYQFKAGKYTNQGKVVLLK